MNAKTKARWVKALRSGKYPQTTGALKVTAENASPERPAGYCCLGVLREVCPSFKARNGGNGNAFLAETLSFPFYEQQPLASMNDDGVPFEMIAGLVHYAL